MSRGRSHLLAAVGNAVDEAGDRVQYSCATYMVQRLQAARRDRTRERELAKLDRYHLPSLDDITYARNDQAETRRKTEPPEALKGRLSCARGR